MKIDAEVSFWKYEKTFNYPLIRENKLMQQQYLPEQISHNLERNGIDGCIAVVVEPAEVETRFLSELAVTHPQILAVVGWIDLYDPNAIEKIQAFQQYTHIRGYQIEIRKDPLPAHGVMEILQENQYSLDISLSSENVPEGLSKWLRDWPDQYFILRDCAHPDTKKAPSKTWEKTIRELGKNQNLSCKLSGLFTHGNRKSWKPADFYPFLEILFESFGSERLLFASEWPFLLLAGIYVQWKSLLEKFMERFRLEDRDKFFGENAERLYRL
ncbi:MAG TPA: amidohydrolase family protein [Puia sp.]